MLDDVDAQERPKFPVDSRVHGATVITRLPMPAESGGATGGDRPERPLLDRDQPMRASIRRTMGAHNVRQLRPRDAGDRRA